MKKKNHKFIVASILLVMSISLSLLTGCQNPEPDPSSDTSIGVTGDTSDLNIEIADQKLNLLTGEHNLDEKEYGKRPVAVMINNIKKTWPQAGIASADILYEMEVEGGITRLLAVFASSERLPEKLGSVRSMRPYYINLAAGHDAIFVGHGWSGTAQDLLQNKNTIDFINASNGGKHGAAFYRDAAKAKEKGREHSSYTSKEKLQAVIKTLEFRTELDDDWKNKTFLNFRSPDDMQAVGKTCTSLYVPFSNYAKTQFTYDTGKKVYLKEEYSEKHIDEATGNQLAFTNVLVLFMPVGMEDAKHLTFDFTASGAGYYASQGKIQEVKWAKGWNYKETFKFLGEDGKGLVANPGKTMVCIVRDTRQSELTFE